MVDEETTIINNENNSNNTEKKSFKHKGIIFIIILIVLVLSIGIYIYNVLIPLKGDNLTCFYKPKYSKIICEQTGDIVPEWLDVSDNSFVKYTMQLILSHDKKDYKVLNMTNKIFIKDMNRKFIYELGEQTFFDWIQFKKYALKSSTNNWGSIILYCSDTNLDEDICKRMKKQYKK